MNHRKLTRYERLKLRQQLAEIQLIRARAKERSFDYVVNPPEMPRVAFGSSQQREIMPLRGPQMPQIMRKTLGEYREYPGPTDYHPEILWDLAKDFPSKLGFSAFCSKAPRLYSAPISNVPPIGSYNTEPFKPIKPAAKPFGLHEPHPTKEFLTPAPSTYPHEIPLNDYKVSTAFNTCRIFWPAVAVFCTPINLAKCIICEQVPLGDYWHNFDSGLDICRTCMRRKKSVIKSCAMKSNQRRQLLREVSGYVQARYCGFYHDHNGVCAAIPLMSQKLLRFKIRKENYLHKYID